jgi:hypothetical protein
MKTNKIKRKVDEFLSKGWKVNIPRFIEDSDCRNYRVISPLGNIFPDCDVLSNICCICEDADIYGCSGLHSDENLEEQDKAYRFCRLLEEGRIKFDIFRYIGNVSK